MNQVPKMDKLYCGPTALERNDIPHCGNLITLYNGDVHTQASKSRGQSLCQDFIQSRGHNVL